VSARRPRWTSAALVALAVAIAGCSGHHQQSAHLPTGTQLHVDGDQSRCDDGRNAKQARSAATPLCTIARAIGLSSPGTVVAVAPGNYPALVTGRTGSGWVTIRGAGPGPVRLPRIELKDGASGLAFERLELTGSPDGPTFQVDAGESRNVRLVASRVEATHQDAIVLGAGARGVTIARNHIHTAPSGSGVAFASTSTLPGSPPGAENQAPIVDVVIRDNHFDGIAVDAIRPANFEHLVVEGNEIEGVIENGQHADALQTVFGGRDLVFRNNYIHDNQSQGLFINDGRVTGVIVEGNVIVHNTREIALQFYDTVGLRIAHNTVWDNEANVALRTGVRDAVVTGNIFQDMVVDDPAAAALAVRQDHNLIAGGWNWGARGADDITTPPTFVDPGRDDYRLAPRSAGIEDGRDLGAPAHR
jgi:hypothetical protein